MLAIFALLLLSTAHATEKIRVVSPQTLAAVFPDGISERPALFGVPSYATELQSPVQYATPGDLNGCQPLTMNTTNGARIMMIDRGNCSFVMKVRNAQEAGAAAAIVVDNVDESNIPFMADDGSGSSVSIPSMLIHRADGQRIKDALADGTTVVLSLEWSLPHPDGIVEWSFWTSAADDKSEEFKSVFEPAYKSLGDKAIFTPRYYILDGHASGCQTAAQRCGNQCTNGGRYCAVDPEHDTTVGISGQNIIKENLRQLCVFQVTNTSTPKTTDKWWEYVSAFDAECAQNATTWTEACSDRLLDTIGVSRDAVNQCMTNAGGTDNDVENTLLAKEMNDRVINGIFYLPTVTINMAPHRGSLDCPLPLNPNTCGVLSAICAAYSYGTKPDVCFTSDGCDLGLTRDSCNECKTRTADNFNVCAAPASSGKLSVFWIVVIVLVAVTVVGAGVYVYMTRQQAAMRDDIDALLKRYLPLEEANNSAHPLPAEEMSLAIQ